MAGVYYYKIPIGKKSRVKKKLDQLLKRTPTSTSKKQFYRGENILVSLENHVATVLYDKKSFSEDTVKALLIEDGKAI